MVAALDLHREAALPVPLPGGLAALCTPATGFSFTIPENGSFKIPAVLQIPCRKLLQKKSQFTIHFH